MYNIYFDIKTQHENCTFLPSNAAINVFMWRQSCRLSYGSVMIPLCSVTLEWLIHSKQACWKGSATWIEHTVWVIQHVLIETSGNFLQFYVQCMWTGGSVVPPPPPPIQWRPRIQVGVEVLWPTVQTFNATFHLLALILSSSFEKKKGKENQTDKRKLKNMGRGGWEENLYLFKVDLKRLQVYFILLLL